MADEEKEKAEKLAAAKKRVCSFAWNAGCDLLADTCLVRAIEEGAAEEGQEDNIEEER